jgi:hypothetical protein
VEEMKELYDKSDREVELIEQRIGMLASSAASTISETWRGKDDACDRIEQAAVEIAEEVFGEYGYQYEDEIRDMIWSFV